MDELRKISALNIAFALAVALLCFSPCGGVTVTFKGSSIVAGPNVRLGDVAQIQGATPEDFAALRDLTVSKHVLAGRTRVLSSARIKALCLRSRPSLAFEFVNEGKIRVLRDSRKITGSEIAKTVENFILSNMPWDTKDAGIILTRYPDNITIPNTPYRLRVVNTGYDYIGSGVLDPYSAGTGGSSVLAALSPVFSSVSAGFSPKATWKSSSLWSPFSRLPLMKKVGVEST